MRFYKPARRTVLLYAALILFSALFLFAGNRWATAGNDYFAGASSAEDYYRARVLWAAEPRNVVEEYGDYTFEAQTIQLRARLLSGFMKGEEIEILDQKLEQNSPARVYPFRAGDEIFVSFTFDENDDPVWYATDHVRQNALLGLVVGFLALLVVFGRLQGVKTVVTLVFTVSAVFLVMIPAIIKGANLYALTFVIAAFITVMTLGIVSGLSAKSLAAAAGCIGGVAVAGALAVVMQRAMRISGYVNEDSSFVLLINPERPIDLRGVLFGALVIGALGAVMDVAMSIASALEELILYTPGISAAELLRSGLRIGRDIMGTMANTLVLAYVGSSLHVILLLMAYNRSASAVLSREMVAVEVLQAVAGSIGILCAVPATALVMAGIQRLHVHRSGDASV